MRTTRSGLLVALCLSFSALPALADAAAVTPGSPAGAALPLSEQPDPLFDDEFDEGAAGVYDPFEGGNRAILRFNQGVDRVLWSPLTRAYRFAVPAAARSCVRRAFGNLNTPIYMVNHLLQLRPLDAAETFAAFVLNTGWGLGGLFDAASAANLERIPADFGQTLAVAGVEAGPYLVIPVFGPSTVRDGIGWVVDRAFHPLTYVLGVPVQAVGYGGVGMAERDAVADEIEALEESSLDFYAVLRSAYAQAREKRIAEARGGDDVEPGDVAANGSPRP